MASYITDMLRKNSVVNLDAQTFEEEMMKDPNAVLLDTRTKPENDEVRIPNSTLIDLMRPDFQNEIEKLDKSKSYYVYCRSGNRSYHACRLMKNLGFEKVYNLEPGIIGWRGEVEQNF